jgi:hypothetical protein
MNLKTFQKQIDATVLQQGKKYFEESRVEDLDNFDDCFWCASVMDSEEYLVELVLDGYKIVEFECDCSDSNLMCKHVVAVMFTICEKTGLLKTTSESVSKVKSTKLNIKKLVDKITEKELREFVLHYSKINKSFKSDFELYFATKDENFDVNKQVASQVKAAVKKFKKWNYIDYSSSNGLGRELYNISKQGDQYLSKGNFLDAYNFWKVFIQETIPVLDYSDDSSGSISDVIESAVDAFIDLAYQAPAPLKETIANYLKTEIQDLKYFSYGNYGYALTDLYADLCSDLNRSDEFIIFIKTMLQGAKSNNDTYDYEYFLTKLIHFLLEEGQDNEAEKLIKENIHLPKIRVILINELIEEREFESAKALINEGLLLAEKDRLFGLVGEWKKFLLHIAELQGDSTTMRKYLENLAFESSFNKEYYVQWKESYAKDEWQEVIKNKIDLIKDNVLKEQKSFKRSMQMPDYVLLYLLGPIFVEEKMFDQLIDLVCKQSDLQIVLRFHPYLYQNYPQELMGLYLPLLNEQAEIASDRSGYKKLLQVVQSIYKDIPAGRSLLTEQTLVWKNSYKRRPAMIDEINNFLLKVS